MRLQGHTITHSDILRVEIMRNNEVNIVYVNMIPSNDFIFGLDAEFIIFSIERSVDFSICLSIF